MKSGAKQSLVVSLTLGAVALSLYFAVVGRSPKVELGAYEALGAGTAEETARLLENQGQVLVMARDTGAEKNPSVEAQLAAFRRTLKRHAGLSQVTVRFQATPLTMMATGGGVPPDQLASALRTHPDSSALVLFCGLPPLTDAERAALGNRGIKTVVVAAFRPEYAELLERETIHLVIAPRPEGPPPGTRAPRTWRELFDQEYAVVTAARAARRTGH